MGNILITGGAGFIGSNFVRYWTDHHFTDRVVVLDKLTYAGKLSNLQGLLAKIDFEQGDICDKDKVKQIFLKYNIDGVIHFAAESHVDNSIKSPFIFTQTNVLGTHVLLETAREIWGEGSKNKFVHISTDEVYGSLNKNGYFTEESPIQPSSPYSASKASSDLIALTYYKTYNMNVSVTNCSNNYGPNQDKEKLIPHMIELALQNKPLTVYGDGSNIRDWLYVEDHCKAIDLVFHAAAAGTRYNIGGYNEKTNLEIVNYILETLNKPKSLITFVEDRKGHDYRYAIDSTKIQKELGWKPIINIEMGLQPVIEHYKNLFENN